MRHREVSIDLRKLGKTFFSVSTIFLLTALSPILFLGMTVAPEVSAASPMIRVDGISSYGSYNWAGYGANFTGGVTQVKGSWTQPTVTCNTKIKDDQLAVFWAGIDGVASPTVEQTGTIAECVEGSSTPAYFAWYEFYPSEPSLKIISTIAVQPGNVFSATVKYSSTTGKFTVTLQDVTTGVKYSKSDKVASAARSSAECIVEAPGGDTSNTEGIYPLAKFSTVGFGLTNTQVKGTCEATVNAVTKGIGSFSTDSHEFIMFVYPYSPPGTPMATPSAITAGKSFTVTWDNAGP
jgi:hypothetical protein